MYQIDKEKSNRNDRKDALNLQICKLGKQKVGSNL